jgi:hypothetical protein
MASAFRSLSEEFGALNPERLATLESEWDCHLPDDYRAFLLANNGGEPDRWDYGIPFLERGEPSEAGLQVVFGIQEPWESPANILWVLEAYAGRLPDGFLPIARDPGGNLLVLRVRGEPVGQVWFWDHEGEHRVSGEEPLANMSWVASSFTEFVAGFRVSEEPAAESGSGDDCGGTGSTAGC